MIFAFLATRVSSVMSCIDFEYLLVMIIHLGPVSMLMDSCLHMFNLTFYDNTSLHPEYDIFAAGPRGRSAPRVIRGAAGGGHVDLASGRFDDDICNCKIGPRLGI